VPKAETFPDYEGPYGWKDAIQAGIDMLGPSGFNCIRLAASTELAEATTSLGKPNVLLGRFQDVFKRKVDPTTGLPLPGRKALKYRVTFAPHNIDLIPGATYAGCGCPITNRVITQWTAQVQGIQTTIDVPNAYYKGIMELIHAVRATKYTIGLRILLREIGLAPTRATPLFTDSQTLLDGTECERVSREAKWAATRYGMMRVAIEDQSIGPRPIPTHLNIADPMTKALTGATFIRHRAELLGLPPPAPPSSTPPPTTSQITAGPDLGANLKYM